MQSQLGFSHFIHNADAVAMGILVLLLLFSVSCWYLIVTKGISSWKTSQRTKRFLGSFWTAADLKAAGEWVRAPENDDPFSRIARKGFDAVELHRTGHARGLMDAGGCEEFVERALKQAYDEERVTQEMGLTWLATVASSAPFIGLFGTVWGIYHALLAIGLSGQGTLDKVAGPVGEALIMTAIGLGVAIPAAIAYNSFGRMNRRLLARLDSFAQDVLTVLSTGLRVASMEGR